MGKDWSPVLAWVGPTGSGKTTMTELTLHLLSQTDQGPWLVIDASPQETFSRLRTPFPKALSDSLEGLNDDPLSHQQIDFFFAEQVTALSDNTDMLTLGEPLTSISPVLKDILTFGLPRLLDKNYNGVIVDGWSPLLEIGLKPERFWPVYLCKPTDPPPKEVLPKTVPRTPALIVNHADTGDISPEISEALKNNVFRMLGRIPHYSTTDALIDQCPQALLNCLFRMDWSVGQWPQTPPTPLPHDKPWSILATANR